MSCPNCDKDIKILQGPTGPQGPIGPQGPPGDSVDCDFVRGCIGSTFPITFNQTGTNAGIIGLSDPLNPQGDPPPEHLLIWKDNGTGTFAWDIIPTTGFGNQYDFSSSYPGNGQWQLNWIDVNAGQSFSHILNLCQLMGEVSISCLMDVNFPVNVDREANPFLKYNPSTGCYEPSSASDIGFTCDSLATCEIQNIGNVVINSASLEDNQQLSWDNTNGYWTNRVGAGFTCTDLDGCTLDHLGDVRYNLNTGSPDSYTAALDEVLTVVGTTAGQVVWAPRPITFPSTTLTVQDRGTDPRCSGPASGTGTGITAGTLNFQGAGLTSGFVTICDAGGDVININIDDPTSPSCVDVRACLVANDPIYMDGSDEITLRVNESLSLTGDSGSGAAPTSNISLSQTIIEITVADAVQHKSGNGTTGGGYFIPGATYKLTDALQDTLPNVDGVWLKAISTTELSAEGTIREIYGGTGQIAGDDEEFCVFHFDAALATYGKLIRRIDNRGNDISGVNGEPEAFPWGYSDIENNTMKDCPITTTGVGDWSTITMNANHMIGGSLAIGDNANVEQNDTFNSALTIRDYNTFSANKARTATVTMNTQTSLTAGNMTGNEIIETNITTNSGTSLTSCYLHFTETAIDFNDNEVHTTKTLRPGYSDFEHTIDITGLNTIDLSATRGTAYPYIGIVYMTSTGTDDIWDLHSGFNQSNHPIRFEGANATGSAFTTTIKAASIATAEAGSPTVVSQFVLPPNGSDAAQDTTLNLHRGDWIELKMHDYGAGKGNIYRQTNSEVYV